MSIYSVQEAQITLLVGKKIKIITKYWDFLDVFLKKNASILLKATKIN